MKRHTREAYKNIRGFYGYRTNILYSTNEFLDRKVDPSHIGTPLVMAQETQQYFPYAFLFNAQKD